MTETPTASSSSLERPPTARTKAWLRGLGLAQHGGAFGAEEVTLALLEQQLRAGGEEAVQTSLRSLGLGSMGSRMKARRLGRAWLGPG